MYGLSIRLGALEDDSHDGALGNLFPKEKTW